MRYTINIAIGKDKYGYDEVKNEAVIECDELRITTMIDIACAMLNDATAKAKKKFEVVEESEPLPSPAPPKSAPVVGAISVEESNVF